MRRKKRSSKCITSLKEALYIHSYIHSFLSFMLSVSNELRSQSSYSIFNMRNKFLDEQIYLLMTQ